MSAFSFITMRDISSFLVFLAGATIAMAGISLMNWAAVVVGVIVSVAAYYIMEGGKKNAE